MADVSIWSGVGVAVQSALGGSQSVTGISKASPAVVTYVGADPANGDYIKLTALGMTEMNARVVRVANVNTGSNTFEAEGVDSTLYGTFSSGSMEPVTFGITISTLTGRSAGNASNRPFRSILPSPGSRRSQRAVWIICSVVKCVPAGASQICA